MRRLPETKLLSIQNLKDEAQNKVKLFSDSNRKTLVNSMLR